MPAVKPCHTWRHANVVSCNASKGQNGKGNGESMLRMGKGTDMADSTDNRRVEAKCRYAEENGLKGSKSRKEKCVQKMLGNNA